jgi:2-dehydro-3-deoxyphosphogluconate aldolase/(4S)-4-hydroxy-2-oxoglutarate aldolase
MAGKPVNCCDKKFMAYQPIQNTIDHFLANPVVPVFYHHDKTLAGDVLRVCYDAGIRTFEFTNRGPEAAATFVALRELAASRCPGLKLGIGTLFSYRAAQDFLAMGCDFVVSPALMPDMAQIQSASYTLWIPGCATLSELAHAQALGARMMKLFPAGLLGPGFAAAALSVMPELKLMPTGGVEPTPECLQAWFNAGVGAVGMGSQLITKEIVAKRDWKKLHDNISRAVSATRDIKNT